MEQFKTLGPKPAQYDGIEMDEDEDDDGNVKTGQTDLQNEVPEKVESEAA